MTRTPAWLTDLAEGLRARPGRAGLAFLSIAVGMASLCGLLAVTAGLQAKTRQIVAELGVATFALLQPAAEAGAGRDFQPLNERHVEALRAALPAAAVAGVRLYTGAETGLPDGTVLLAADASLGVTRPWRPIGGRLPDDTDVRSRTRCAAVSVTLARELGLLPGGELRIRGQPYPVVGVFEANGSETAQGAGMARFNPGERLVLVPGSLPPYWLAGDTPPRRGLDAIYVRVREPSRFEPALERARTLLGQPDLRAEPVTWVTPESLVRRWTRYQRAVSAVGGGVAVLCLLMGGTTLMSLLLAGVRERMPEIGLRRSLGASRRDVARLFTAEAVIVTGTATLAGMGAAVLGGLVVGGRLGLPWAWNAWCVAAPPTVGLALAVAFSYWPARVAATMPPAQALRSE